MKKLLAVLKESVIINLLPTNIFERKKIKRFEFLTNLNQNKESKCRTNYYFNR